METEITDKSAIDDEKEDMKLYFNDTEIPVIWEDNQTDTSTLANKVRVIMVCSLCACRQQKTGTMTNTEKSSTASRTALRNFEVFVI